MGNPWSAVWIALGIAFAIVWAFLRNQKLPKPVGRGLQEPRLIGTWMSDAERTLKGYTDVEAEKLGRIFGKMRVTYNGSELHTELDGSVQSAPYVVLGVDENSCVIQDNLNLAPTISDLGLSSFTKIHFEGKSYYWVSTEIGGIQEYFRKIAD